MTTFTVQPDAATGKDTSVISGNPTNNNGTSVTLFAATTSKGLLEFDCSSIPSTAVCDNATLYLYQIATGSNSSFTITVRSIASGNEAWIEGTRNAAVALAGEPCWNARVANGAGGVTTAWAGSAGLSTSGTDFEATALGTVSGNRTNVNGTEYAIALTALRVQGWFGASNTNYGMLLNANASVGGIGSSDHATAAWRPKLVINYTEAGGSPQTVNLDAIASTATVAQPAIAVGAVTVIPELIASAATVHAPAVTVGAVTISPTLVASTAIVYGPTVTQAAAELQTVSVNQIASSEAVYAPDVTVGAVTVVPDLIASGEIVYEPLVTIPSLQTVEADFIASAEVVYPFIIALFTVSAERMYRVPIQNREFVVVAESRLYTVEAENLVSEIAADGRVYAALADERMYTVT